MAYKNSSTLFRTVLFPTFYALPPLSLDWRFATPTQNSIAITPGTGKATNFKFCTHIHSIDRNKSPLKISGKVAVHGRSQGLPKIFRAPTYTAHRAVIFATTQLSCFHLAFTSLLIVGIWATFLPLIVWVYLFV